MKFRLILAVIAGILLLALAVQAQNDHRIYGKVHTYDGDVYEGLIRWDKNEASWTDLLDGTKKLDEKNFEDRDRERRRETSIEIFGITIGKSASIWDYSSAQCGIRFGHIKRIDVLDDDRAEITLKSGHRIELENSSTDLGSNMREFIVEDIDEGEVQLLWDDIEFIEFESTDGDLVSNYGERLYGTLTTRRGDSFTGFVGWDVDEALGRDILDGDENGRSRKIRFDKIAAIERYSSSGAIVIFRNGEEITLRGSNDVDDDNRGIIIADPAFGQVVVDWDEFDRLEFTKAPGDVRYDNFDGGKELRGTVYTENGERYQGRIRWDNDEEYTWEILDGEFRDIDFDIELGQISKLEKRSHRSSIVTLLDGREFRLRGSNDVDGDNKGIFVFAEGGDEILIDWDEFAYVEFDN